MSLSISNIRKCFKAPGGREVVAVEGASLSLAPGELCAIHGPSGSGKTTLLLMAGALLSPDSGSVSVRGANPYTLGAVGRARLRAEGIGFVFQQFHLLPYLNVLENSMIPVLAGGVKGAEERARELLGRFGLGHRILHTPGALSVGERRRVALARALLRAPPILIADELTGDLDKENAAAIMAYVVDFASGGGTVLLATHDESVMRVAGLRLEMREGRLA